MEIEKNEVYTTSNGFRIPYKIITERRRSARASIGQKGLSIRVPKVAGKKWKIEKINDFLLWVNELAQKNPVSLIRFYPFEYQKDDIITIYNKVYHIIPSSSENTKLKIKKAGDSLAIPEIAMDKSNSNLVIKAISNLFKAHYLSRFIHQVQEINKRSLKVDYTSVNMNHTSSKWGSCDSRGRIWLSTRLLCMPEQIQEYIIIHELAHRIIANHSQNFWELVWKHNPNFKNHIKWLKENGALCDFYPERVKQEIKSLNKT